jgi:hypothetical protein
MSITTRQEERPMTMKNPPHQGGIICGRSTREKEIPQLLPSGMSNPKIADPLYISVARRRSQEFDFLKIRQARVPFNNPSGSAG